MISVHDEVETGAANRAENQRAIREKQPRVQNATKTSRERVSSWEKQGCNAGAHCQGHSRMCKLHTTKNWSGAQQKKQQWAQVVGTVCRNSKVPCQPKSWICVIEQFWQNNLSIIDLRLKVVRRLCRTRTTKRSSKKNEKKTKSWCFISLDAIRQAKKLNFESV